MTVTIGPWAMRTDFKCPDWCVRPDHTPGEDPTYHYAPAFGPVEVQAVNGGPFQIRIEAQEMTGPVALQRLFADIYDAVMWMYDRAERDPAGHEKVPYVDRSAWPRDISELRQ